MAKPFPRLDNGDDAMSRHHQAIAGPRWPAVRLFVFSRDGWRCCNCGKAGRLECDHVKPLDRFPDQDPYDAAGLQTLCRGCHIVKTSRERFTAGAFAPIGDVILNAQHDRRTPLARTGGGLELMDSADALEIRAEMPPTQAADDVLALVRANVLRGLSLEFEATAERVEAGVRVIDKARLSGIGVVDSPAYPQSEVEAREAHVAAMVAKARKLRFWL